MKIKTKIYIATAVISILFSGMYFVLLNQLHGLDGKITKAMYANRVRELVVEARRAEENYLRTGNSERIKDFTFSMDEILDSAEKKAPGRAFAVSPDMELITGLARDYRRAFKSEEKWIRPGTTWLKKEGCLKRPSGRLSKRFRKRKPVPCCPKPLAISRLAIKSSKRDTGAN